MAASALQCEPTNFLHASMIANYRVSTTQVQGETSLVLIGAKHGTPVTIPIADTEGRFGHHGRGGDELARLADSS